MTSVLKKGSGSDRSKAAGEAMEWMANDASTSCLICTKQWSMKNRRHHCRRCGRLVCNECSMRTMAFDDSEEPKRICDDCFESVTRKQQVQMEVNYHRERETQLLHATSKVSDSLVRVYFLDGSFKTVFYDEATTCTEIASKLCFSVKMALFEVEKDLRNPSEYVLVPQDECIVNIIARWSINGLNHAKLIIPISDMAGVVKTQVTDRRALPLGGAASTADHLAQAERERELREANRGTYGPGYRGSFMSTIGEGTTTRESIMDSPGKGKRASMSLIDNKRGSMAAGDGGQGDVMGAIQELHDVYAKLEAVSQDNMRLMKEITDIKKKYDILRTIHTKTNKNTRELKREMDGLKAPDGSRRRSGSGDRGERGGGERGRMNSGVRSSFGLTGLSQSLSLRAQVSPAGGDVAPAQEGAPADTQPPAVPEEEDGDDFNSDDETAMPAPSILYKGAMLRKSTGVTKLFKPTYAVFTEQTLSFYSDETMKKLDRSCLTTDAVASVGAKDPSWFCVTTDAEQIVLKTDSSETSELLVSVINEAVEAVRQRAEARARCAQTAQMTLTQAAASAVESTEERGRTTPAMEAIPEEEDGEDGQPDTAEQTPPDEPPEQEHGETTPAPVAASETRVVAVGSPAVSAAVGPLADSRAAAVEDGDGMVHYKSPVLRESTTSLRKKFKNNYIVFADKSLKFYSDETMKKLDKILPTKGTNAVVGPRDPLCLTITNGKNRFVLKFDSVELPRKLEALVNGLANAAAMEASMAPMSDDGKPAGAIVAYTGDGAAPVAPVFRRGSSFKEVDTEAAPAQTVTASANKYEELKDIDSTYQVKVFLDKVAGIETFFRVFDDIMHTTLENGVRESQQVTHTYEIISAMQTLYAGILDYGETWTSVARDWLLRMLRQHMRLPVQEPEILMAVIQCISRENMMFSPDTSEVVNQIIEMSFEDVGNDEDPDFPNSTEGILAGVTRMVETLEQVVEDLVPLLPEDFNVITMYSAKANKKIKSDISTFYDANKGNITNREVLTLLSFADSQKYHLSKFGVDTSVVDTLQADLLQHYSTMVTTLMRQWIGRICDADEKCELQLAKGLRLGMTSHWPEDLLSCVGEQLNLAVSELKPSACERVCTLVLESLTLLISRQRTWLATNIKTLPPERLCAYVNNLDRFARALTERGNEVVAVLNDSASVKLRTFSVDGAKSAVRKDSSDILTASNKVDDGFKSIVKAVVSESRVGLKELITLVCSDFKDGMAAGLFMEDWIEGPQVVETLKCTLDDYVGDLAEWLASKEDVDRVILGILRAVTNTYLEMLLTSSLLVTPRVAERLSQDVHILVVSFSEFEQHISEEVLDAEIHPLKCVTDLMSKDPRQMSKFVRDEMYPMFGAACMKVWQAAMQLRADVQGKSEVYQAMHDAIMVGWDPPFVKPSCVISFQDKLKAGQKIDSKGRRIIKK